MAMTNEQLTKWIDEIFGTIDEIKQNSGDISGLTRSVKQLREDLTATQEDVSDLETDTAGTVSLAKAALQHFTDGSATQALDLVADIIPVQAGTGDPSPTNVRAISGYSSVTATAAGKNLFDINSLIVGGIDNDGKDYQDGDPSYRRTPFIFVKAGKYTIKRTGNTDKWWKACFYNDANQYAGTGFVFNTNEDSTITFTVQSDCWIRIAFDYVPLSSDNIQLEDGETATTYEPYTANTATISLGSTVYSGTVNFTTGELYIDKGIVDLGSLTWTYQADQQRFYKSYVDAAAVPNTEIADALCSSYKVVAANDVVPDNDKVIALSASKNIVIRDTDYSDPDLFKAALDGVKLVFPLATPTTTTLTPAQLSLLQGENNVSATSGPITLTYAPDNVLAEVYAYIQKRFDTLTASLAANRTTRKTTKTLTKKED